MSFWDEIKTLKMWCGSDTRTKLDNYSTASPPSVSPCLSLKNGSQAASVRYVSISQNNCSTTQRQSAALNYLPSVTDAVLVNRCLVSGITSICFGVLTRDVLSVAVNSDLTFRRLYAL